MYQNLRGTPLMVGGQGSTDTPSEFHTYSKDSEYNRIDTRHHEEKTVFRGRSPNIDSDTTPSDLSDTREVFEEVKYFGDYDDNRHTTIVRSPPILDFTVPISTKRGRDYDLEDIRNDSYEPLPVRYRFYYEPTYVVNLNRTPPKSYIPLRDVFDNDDFFAWFRSMISTRLIIKYRVHRVIEDLRHVIGIEDIVQSVFDLNLKSRLCNQISGSAVPLDNFSYCVNNGIINVDFDKSGVVRRAFDINRIIVSESKKVDQGINKKGQFVFQRRSAHEKNCAKEVIHKSVVDSLRGNGKICFEKDFFSKMSKITSKTIKGSDEKAVHDLLKGPKRDTTLAREHVKEKINGIVKKRKDKERTLIMRDKRDSKYVSESGIFEAFDQVKAQRTTTGAITEKNMFAKFMETMYDQFVAALGRDLKQYSQYFEIIYDVSIFCYWLVRSRNVTDRTVAIVDLVKKWFGVSALRDVMTMLLKVVPRSFAALWNCFQSRRVTENVISGFDDMRRVFSCALNHDLLNAMRDFILGLVTTKWLSKDVSSVLIKTFGKPKFVSIFGLMDQLLYAVSMLLKSGEALLSGVPLSTLLFDGDNVSSMIKQIRTHLLDKDNLYFGMPVAMKRDAIIFARDGQRLSASSDIVIKTKPTKHERYEEFMSLKTKLDFEVSAVKNRIAAGARAPPMAILLHGDPSIGKSLLISYLARMCMYVSDMEYYEGCVFPRSSGQEYWTGYDTYEHPIIHYSELGAQSVNIAKMSVDELYNEMLSVIDGLAFLANMAEVEKKGRVYVCPQWVLADTNNKTFHSEARSFSVNAQLRRWFFLSVKVHPDFTKDDSTAIDSEKSMASDKKFLDKYMFTGETWNTRDATNSGEFKTIFKDVDIYEMTKSLATIMADHKARQHRVLQLVQENISVGDYIKKVETVTGIQYETVEERTKAIKNLEAEADNILNDLKDEKQDPPPDVAYCTRNAKDDELYVEKKISEAFCFPMESTIGYVEEKFPLLTELPKPVIDSDRDIAAGAMLDAARTARMNLNNSEIKIKLEAKRRSWKSSFAYKKAKLMAFCHYGNTLFWEEYNTYFGRYFELQGAVSSYLVLWSMFFVMMYVHRFKEMKVCFKIAYAIILYLLPLGRYQFEDFALKIAVFWVSHSKLADDFVYMFKEYHKRKLYVRMDTAKGQIIKAWNREQHYFVEPWYLACGVFVVAAIDQFRRYLQVQACYTSESYKSELLEHEERVSAGVSRKRLPNKVLEIYNVVKQNPAPTNGLSSVDLCKFLAKSNVEMAYLVHNGQSYTCTVLGVKGQFVLLNKHSFPTYPPEEGDMIMFSNIDDLSSSQNKAYQKGFLSNMLRVDVGGDLVLLLLDTGRCYRNVLHHFPPGDLTDGRYRGCVLFGDNIFKLQAQHEKGMMDYENSNVKNQIIVLTDFYTYEAKMHEGGRSGSPLVVETGSGSFIAGIHSAADKYGTKCFAEAITRDTLEKAIQSMTDRNSFVTLVSQSSLPFEFEDPIPKSSVFYTATHGAEYYGKLPGNVLMKNKSRLRKSPIFYDIPLLFAEFGMVQDTEFGKPMMEPTWHDGVYYNPWQLALEKMCSEKAPVDRLVIERGMNEYLERILASLEVRSIRRLNPLTIEIAINGCLEDPLIRRVDASKAAGFGFKGKKSAHIPLVDDFTREPTPELQDEIQRILDCYHDEIMSYPMMQTALKDEARERSKCLTGNTRLFCISQFAFLIVCRMFLAPIYSLMIEMPDVFCCSIGINIEAKAHIMKEMEDFSPDFMEGDYSKFDQKIPFMIGLAAHTVVYRIAVKLGYNEHALKMLRGIMTDLMFPIVIINGDVFIIPGYQGSGKYGTLEDNCNRGIMLLVSAFYHICGILSERKFFDDVKPIVCGDDVATASKVSYFNNNTYAAVCRDLFGMDYTSASKSSVFPDFLRLSDISFLKRNFRYRDDIKKWVAPLAPTSIMRSLMWILKSDFVPDLEHIKAIAESATWAMFSHLNREDHDRFRTMLADLIFEFYGFRPELPTFEHVLDSIFREDEKYDGTRPGISGPDLPLTLGLPTARRDTIGVYLVSESTTSQDTTNTLYDEKMKDLFEGPSNSGNKEAYLVSVKRWLRDLYRCSDANPFGMNGYSMSALYSMISLSSDIRIVDKAKWQLTLLARISDAESTLAVLTSSNKPRYVVESGVAEEMGSTGAISNMETKENIVDVMGDESDVITQVDNKSVGRLKELNGIDMFFERYVELAKGAVSIGSHLGLTLSIWNLLANAPTIRAKFRNYAFFRGRVRVRVVISGTPFHMGKVLVSYQPFASYNTNLVKLTTAVSADPAFRPMLINYLSQAPDSYVMDIKENKPLELELEFIAPKPNLRLFNNVAGSIGAATDLQDFSVMGDLKIFTINTIAAINATSTPIYYQVYARFEDVTLGTNTATMLAITTESKKSERIVGPVEGVATKIAHVSAALTKVPFLKPYAQVSEILSTGIAKFAAIFGFSKPVLPQKPNFVKNQPFVNSSNTIGFETVMKLCLDPECETAIDPSICGTHGDPMAIRELTSRKTYLTSFTWADDADPQVPIFLLPVTPQLGTFYQTLFDYIQPTSMAYIASLFEYWHGSVTFRFEFVCSSFHRGKPLLFWEPNGSQSSIINGGISLNKQCIMLGDLQDTQTFDICIKWCNERMWLHVPPANVAITYSSQASLASGVNYSNGYIGMCPYTELQSPDSSDIQCNVYVWSDDMEFNGLTSANLPQARRYVSESAMVPPTQSCINSQEVSCVELNPSTSNANPCLEYFGEQPVSLRSLMKRWMTTDHTSTNLGLSLSTGIITYASNIYPPNSMDYGFTAITTVDLFSYLRYAYLGRKGSVRVRPRIRGSENIPNAQLAKISLEPSSTTDVTPAAYYNSSGVYMYSMIEGSLAFAPKTNNGIDAELPFYTSNLWLVSFNSDPTPGASSGIFDNDYFRSWKFEIDYNLPPANQGTVTVSTIVDRSIGEDFTFLRYQGAPFYSRT